MEGFLLGMAYAALKKIQDHLVQAEHQEALTLVNDTCRDLTDAVNKHFAPKVAAPQPTSPEQGHA